MIWDEVSLHARLSSPLYGALLHVLDVTMPALGTDLAAARVVELPANAGLGSCVVARAAGLTWPQERALQVWPSQPESVFSQLQRLAVRDRAFRPRDVLPPNLPLQAMFKPILPLLPVYDMVALSVTVQEPLWAILLYVRGMARGPFTSDALTALERLRDAVANVLSAGYRHQLNEAQQEPWAERPRQYESEMATKLTRTEREILPLLQTTSTEREIAGRVHRSPHTIHVHVKNIYRKLGVTSRRELHDLLRVNANGQTPVES